MHERSDNRSWLKCPFCVNEPLFRRPFDSSEITSSVDDPDHLHPVFRQAVKRQPTFDNERPGVFGNFWTRRAELRVILQQLTGALDVVIDPVGDGVGIP